VSTRAARSFDPLLPAASATGPLLERAAELVAEGHRLEAGTRGFREALRALLRVMNSYYTNRIEGQQTRPADIERALAKQFDADEALARKQRLALSHIQAETALEASLPERQALYSATFVQHIHAELYSKLPAGDRRTDRGVVMTPGALRISDVTAGRHLAPAASDVTRLLAEWGNAYSAVPGVEQAVVAAACSHHRLLWVHPFPDGNGRTARLHAHLVMTALGLTQGVWSPLRGMARDQEGYYARLNNADLERRNDLDGRGALSQEELVAFARWLLDLCLEQARFMRGLLELDGLRARLGDLLLWLSAHPWRLGSEKSLIKIDALEPLHYVAVAGPVERARFLAMLGLPSRTARRVLASLLDFGVLVSSGPRAAVAFGIPLASLRFLFPRLWPEAEADVS
jgi:Fic family protein